MRATIGRPERAFGRHLDNRDIRDSITWRIIDPPMRRFVQELSRLQRELGKWDEIMARKTYRIELKIDFNEDANHEVMLGIAKQYARDLLGSAMLLQDGRKPAVALITDDSFHGVDEIDLLDEGNTLHT